MMLTREGCVAVRFIIKASNVSSLCSYYYFLATCDEEEKLLSVVEVECEVSSQVEYSLQAIWGVSIRELHLALWKPWSTLRDASLNGTLLEGHAQYYTPPQTYPLVEFIRIFQFLT